MAAAPTRIKAPAIVGAARAVQRSAAQLPGGACLPPSLQPRHGSTRRSSCSFMTMNICSHSSPFRALMSMASPSMYVFFGEHHIKWQPVHRLAVYRRTIDWFDFWLRCQEDPAPGKEEQYRRWRELRAPIESVKLAAGLGNHGAGSTPRVGIDVLLKYFAASMPIWREEGTVEANRKAVSVASRPSRRQLRVKPQTFDLAAASKTFGLYAPYKILISRRSANFCLSWPWQEQAGEK